MENTVKFFSTTRDKYDNLAEKDENALYFVPGCVYKGDVPASPSIVHCETLPETLNPETVYITSDKSCVYSDITQNRYVLTPEYVDVIEQNTPSSELKVPTSYAVAAAIVYNKITFSQTRTTCPTNMARTMTILP